MASFQCPILATDHNKCHTMSCASNISSKKHLSQCSYLCGIKKGVFRKQNLQLVAYSFPKIFTALNGSYSYCLLILLLQFGIELYILNQQDLFNNK